MASVPQKIPVHIIVALVFHGRDNGILNILVQQRLGRRVQGEQQISLGLGRPLRHLGNLTRMTEIGLDGG